MIADDASISAAFRARRSTMRHARPATKKSVRARKAAWGLSNRRWGATDLDDAPLAVHILTERVSSA
jgi:hypothetical protein